MSSVARAAEGEQSSLSLSLSVHTQGPSYLLDRSGEESARALGEANKLGSPLEASENYWYFAFVLGARLCGCEMRLRNNHNTRLLHLLIVFICTLTASAPKPRIPRMRGQQVRAVADLTDDDQYPISRFEGGGEIRNRRVYLRIERVEVDADAAGAPVTNIQ